MKRFHIIYLLVGLASWLGTLFLVGCANDTGSLPDQTPEEELIPVTISIGVDDAEDLFTRAEGDESEEGTGEGGEGDDTTPEEPTVHENTANTITEDAKVGDDLVVYIMGRNDYTLTYEDFTYEKTANRYVAEVRLYRGTYHAYAFANHTDFHLTLPDMIEENPIVDAISLVSETNGIPMSGEAEWQVNGADEYEVELVRMVGWMDITIADERGAGKKGKVQSVTISNLLLAQTNLLRAEFGEVTLPYNVDLSEWTWSPTLENDEATTSFYLHETEAGEEGFRLSVSFDGGISKRETTLGRHLIPRNHHFPLLIYLRDYVLDINITTKVPPIGGIPTSQPGKNGYDITLPEGCTFTIEATFKKNGEETSTPWEYELEDKADRRIDFDMPASTSEGATFTFSGTVTSVPYGEDVKINTITLTATDDLGTEGKKNVPFELNFYIRALEDEENTKALRSASTEVQPVIVEL